MPNLFESQKILRQSRSEQNRQESELRRLLQRLQQLEKEIRQMEREGEGPNATGLLEAKRAEAESLQADVAGLRESWQSARLNLSANLRELLKNAPWDLVKELPDTTPFLLMPVKVETKFMGNELWVRFFPDAIAASSHEEELTEAELIAGRQYWSSIWEARTDSFAAVEGEVEGPDEKFKMAQRGAWNTLANGFGPNRSYWIAKATKPFNFDFGDDFGEPQFPEPPLKTAAWTQPPRTRVMPDRFVVSTFTRQEGKLVQALPPFVGAHVPDTLMLGPDPSQLEGEFGRDETTGELKVDAGMAWMVDFEKAVEVGMGVRIPLSGGFAQKGFDRLVVLGLRLSGNAADSAQLVGELFDQHRYTGDVAFLPQGTPTNNAEDAASGYSTLDPGNEKSFEAVTKMFGYHSWAPDRDRQEKQDGQLFAEALGIEYDYAWPVENSEREDVKEALAMNRALWPATLGNFLEEMLAEAFDSRTRDLIKKYFLAYVTGRGFLPAFRVGTQPYGVLVTSAESRWQWHSGEIVEEEKFHQNLLQNLRKLAAGWKGELPKVKHAGDGGEPLQRLLEILGLQATSVDYFSRKGVADEYSWNHYYFKGHPPTWLMTQWDILQLGKRNRLNALGLGSFADLKLKDLTFFDQRQHLYGPVADGEPDVPLSETLGIRPYFNDGKTQLNYIDWLIFNSKKSIEIERFINEKNEGVSPPRALLYMFLRQAYLNEIGNSARAYLVAEKVVKEVPRNPHLLNMKGERHISDRELLDIEPPRLAAELGSEIVRQVIRPDDGFHFTFNHAFEQREAMKKLRGLPTARLERLFAEHMDLCSYRLDAWTTGLFQRRLFYLRNEIPPPAPEEFATEGEGMGFNRGVYLGAYGWVENLRPRTKAPSPVPATTLPEELRKPEKGPVVTDPANGGYVFAPSLNHAVTAAVLRNAYISNAKKGKDSLFAVNLSSRRVRTALSFLEGIRNGQNLAALLGYQLERALHDNPEKEELDEFIYVLRDRFPFTAGKLSEVPEGTPAEAVEASNVVNGYDLLHFTKEKKYPYGLPTGGKNLPVAGTKKANIIAREIDGLAASLDAIGDLALAESVYQVVQGNYDRAGGMLQALGEGKPPPEPDFINTPRNGKVTTNRIAMTFDPNAGTTAAGWGPKATVRSAANAPVNDWLARHLPKPGKVAFEVTAGANAPQPAHLSDFFALQPIDLVLMSGNQLGDQSSELERYLVFQIKNSLGLDEADEVIIDFKKAGASETSLFHLQPLLRSLRKVITEARPLHAQDWMTGVEGQQSPGSNPKGLEVHLEEFRLRVQAIHDRLSGETAGSGLANFYKNEIEGPFQDYFDDPDHVIEAAWEGRLDGIRERLTGLVPLALPEALPGSASGFDRVTLESLVAQVQAVLKIIEKRLKQVDDSELLKPLSFEPDWDESERAAAIESKASAIGQAAKILLNQSFVAVPFFDVQNGSEISACLSQNIEPDELEVEKWLQGISKVREKSANLSSLATVHDLLLEETFEMSPIQLPYRADGRWIGKEFGEDYELTNDVTSILLHPATPPDPFSKNCGLLLDEWTEVVPEREVNAGISFHFNRPNAMPPQALLLAVPPQIKGNWEWEDLMAILHDTLDRAKLRAVEPNQLLQGAAFQTLPAVLTEFTSFNFATVLAHNVIKRAGIQPDPIGAA